MGSCEVKVRKPFWTRDATMLPLLNHDGQELKDARGNSIKNGNTVTDDMFGDGIARYDTIPLEKGTIKP